MTILKTVVAVSPISQRLIDEMDRSTGLKNDAHLDAHPTRGSSRKPVNLRGQF